jgi:prevent-host-death family protein
MMKNATVYMASDKPIGVRFTTHRAPQADAPIPSCPIWKCEYNGNKSDDGDIAMKTLGVHKLTERINEILHRVEEDGETFEVTNHGEVIARLVPVVRTTHPSPEQQSEDAWANLDRLAGEISAHLPNRVDSVNIMRDVRRDL